MNALGQLLAVAALAAVLASPAAAQYRGGDERQEDLAALAEYVDDGAQYVYEQARDALGSLDSGEDALLRSLQDFARQARRLHAAVDRSEANPRPALNRLRQLSRRLGPRLARRPELRALVDDWDALGRDLAEMTRALQGADVAVRRPTPAWGGASGHEHPDPPSEWVEPWPDPQVAEFRRLTSELDAQARKVLALAEQHRGDESARGEEHLHTLRDFAERTATLKRHTDANVLRADQLGPSVEHLLYDARRAEAAMRQARVYRQVWEEWRRTIGLLEQMQRVARRAA